jgi:hypothetical protein
MDLHGEDSFKSKSYSNAAFQIDRMETPLSELQPFQIAGLTGYWREPCPKNRRIANYRHAHTTARVTRKNT